MRDIGYFYEWVAEGAAFGVKAFCAVFTFAAICAAVWGLMSLGAKALGGGGDNGREEQKRRTY